MHPGVDLDAERLTGLDELGKGVVAGAEVGGGGDQVGLRDPDRGLRPALGLRIGRNAGMHSEPIVAGGGDDHRVPDRDTGDVFDGDGLLVVGQRERRHPTTGPERRVQAREQRAHPAVPGRDHHPEPRPRQPGAEQHRRPRSAVGAEHDRAGAPVELQPQPRLGDPRPIRPPMPCYIGGLRCCDRAAGGPLITEKPHRDQPLMQHIGADRTLGDLHNLLDLGHEGVDQLRPAHRLIDRHPGLALGDVGPHRLRVHPRQCCRRMRTPGGVERFENLHDLPVRLLHSPSVGLLGRGQRPRANPGGTSRFGPTRRPTTPTEKGDQLSAGREVTCPPTGILDCPPSHRASGRPEAIPSRLPDRPAEQHQVQDDGNRGRRRRDKQSHHQVVQADRQHERH